MWMFVDPWFFSCFISSQVAVEIELCLLGLLQVYKIILVIKINAVVKISHNTECIM